MPNFSLGGWLFLTVTLASIIGVLGWMVSSGYLPGEVVYAALSAILTGLVGVVFHNAGASAALATPTPPQTPAPTVVPSGVVPPNPAPPA